MFQPKFLTKEQRAAEAIRKRQEEADEKRKKMEEEKKKMEEFMKTTNNGPNSELVWKWLFQIFAIFIVFCYDVFADTKFH